jgi:glycosyltransferase involved in cell wall biosynthesis/MoaA/NifB/PqqE/SkfB family radical SAM enzyme
MMPRVSIIIPCYHSEKHIRQCVESIQAQTFKDWEALFIVDGIEFGGKTDEFFFDLNHSDRRIFHIGSTGKTSPARARNRGIAMSHGDYIAFLDADDWWYPEKLSKQVHYMDTHPEVQWCWAYATHHSGIREYMWDNIWENPAADTMIPFQTIMLRRELVDTLTANGTIPLFDESLPQIDDYDLYLRLKKYPSFHFTEPLAHYREHNGGITSSSSRTSIIRQQLMININRRQYRNLPRMLRLLVGYSTRAALLPYKNRFDKWMESRQLALQIEPTTRCNLTCEKCSRGTDTPIVDLTERTFNEIIAKHPHPHTIILQGLGEPFMHPEFERICGIAKSHCRKLVVITNGTLLNRNDNMARLCFIDHLVISLDTTDPDLAKATRGKGYDVQEVMDSIRAVASTGKSVAVNFVRASWNFNQQAQVKEFCDSLGITLNVTPIQNFYNPEEPEWQAAHKAVWEEREMSRKRDRPFRDHCPFLKGRKFYYDARGREHPCCIRMKYSQVLPTEGTCRTCPE